MAKLPEDVRFWARVNIKESGCWEWEGPLNNKGYGHVIFAKRVHWLAHRYSYVTLIGDIPPDFQIDHLCRNTKCVRPDHLEAVTRLVNMQRALMKPFCKRGHVVLDNVYYYPSGRRECRLCHNIRRMNYHWRKKKGG